MSEVLIALITGIGQAEPLQDLDVLDVETPFGKTSSAVRLATIAGRKIAVLPRRGVHEQTQPHQVPFKANLWALASLGVRVLISSTASTGLHDAFSTGAFVVPDDVIDLTTNRPATYYDFNNNDSEGSVQVTSVDPFDPALRTLAIDALRKSGRRTLEFGTIAVTNGPRYPSAAEMRGLKILGADLTNMTAMPEAILARELGIGVVNVSFITDHATSTDAEHPRLERLQLARLRASQAQRALQSSLVELVANIPSTYTPRQHITEADRMRILTSEL